MEKIQTGEKASLLQFFKLRKNCFVKVTVDVHRNHFFLISTVRRILYSNLDAYTAEELSQMTFHMEYGIKAFPCINDSK